MITKGPSFKIKQIDLSATATVAPAGTETQTLQPLLGKAYQIIDIAGNWPDPAGSGAGDHTLQLYTQNDATNGVYRKISCVSTFGSAINIGSGFTLEATSEVPSGAAQQIELFAGIFWASNAKPILFKYTNGTNVNQTGTRLLKVLVKEYNEMS